MKFKVLVGRHRQGPHTYLQGDVVSSDKLLTELFLNKFEQVPDETPATYDDDVPIFAQPAADVEDSDDTVEMTDLSEDYDDLPEGIEVLQSPSSKELFVYKDDASIGGPFKTKKQVSSFLKSL